MSFWDVDSQYKGQLFYASWVLVFGIGVVSVKNTDHRKSFVSNSSHKGSLFISSFRSSSFTLSYILTFRKSSLRISSVFCCFVVYSWIVHQRMMGISVTYIPVLCFLPLSSFATLCLGPTKHLGFYLQSLYQYRTSLSPTKFLGFVYGAYHICQTIYYHL